MPRRWVVPATAFVAHASALRAGLIWLDHAHLESGAAIAPPSRWLELFTEAFAGTGYYRPLTALSLSIDALAGLPAIYHLTTLVWHALAASMTTLAAEALGLTRRAAVIAGVLFAVHPLGALVASAIAFRSESMIVVALFALVWAHVHRRPIVAAGALVAGALTKETALALAPLFVLALESKAFAPPRVPGRRALFVAEGAALAFALALRAAYAPRWRASYEPLGSGDAIGTRLASLAKSAGRIVFPIDGTICDAFTVTHWWQPASLAGAALAAALAWLVWRRRGPAVLLVLALLPSLQLAPVMRWWSPHYVHVALALVAMLAAKSVDRLGDRACVAVAWACALLGGVSFRDGRRFASDASLWTAEVAARPVCREAQFYLGEEARAARRWELAATRYEAALAPYPGVLAYVDRTATLQNLGTVRLEQGHLSEARGAFEAALAGTTDAQARRELTHDLALVAFRGGDAAEAARLLEGETSGPGAIAASVLLRALALERLGRNEEARLLRARASPR
jgi:hypothetical protein